MEKILVQYCEELTYSLNSFFERSNLGFSQHGIHAFRVIVKKSRGLMLLADHFINNTNAKIVLEPIHAVYKVSGELRDIFIQTKLAHNLTKECPSETLKIISLLKNEERYAYISFIDALYKISAPERQIMFKNIMELFTDKARYIKPYDCIELVRKEQDYINSLLRRHVSFEELHEIRRHIKVLIYTLELLNRSYHGGCIKPKQVKEFNKLQDELGEMNDWVNFEAKLRKLNRPEILYPYLEWNAGVQKNVIRSKLMPGLDKITKYKFSEPLF